MFSFFAFISRMKFINRWALMRNTSEESLSVHSHETAVIAHALCLIGNKRLQKNYDADKAAVIALYHDASEIITGDMPTPVKYFNQKLNTAYKDVERVANEQLLTYLPDDLKPEYHAILQCEDKELLKIVKAADKISALIKCTEELKMGNQEFLKARETIAAAIAKMDCAEANIFIDEFLEGYALSLDELK